MRLRRGNMQNTVGLWLLSQHVTSGANKKASRRSGTPFVILMLYGALLNLAVIDRFVFIWNVSELIVADVALVETTALGSLNTH